MIMDREMLELMSSFVKDKKITLVSSTNTQKVYTCVNEINKKFSSNIVFSPHMEALYIECNGYSNKKFSRGEALEPKDISDFINEALYSRPLIKKSRLLKRRKVILGNIKLDIKID